MAQTPVVQKEISDPSQGSLTLPPPTLTRGWQWALPWLLFLSDILRIPPQVFLCPQKTLALAWFPVFPLAVTLGTSDLLNVPGSSTVLAFACVVPSAHSPQWGLCWYPTQLLGLCWTLQTQSHLSGAHTRKYPFYALISMDIFIKTEAMYFFVVKQTKDKICRFNRFLSFVFFLNSFS